MEWSKFSVRTESFQNYEEMTENSVKIISHKDFKVLPRMRTAIERCHTSDETTLEKVPSGHVSHVCKFRKIFWCTKNYFLSENPEKTQRFFGSPSKN